jgi:hypothetical protein
MGFIHVLVGLLLAIFGAELLILGLGSFDFLGGIVFMIIGSVLSIFAIALMLYGRNKTRGNR